MALVMLATKKDSVDTNEGLWQVRHRGRNNCFWLKIIPRIDLINTVFQAFMDTSTSKGLAMTYPVRQSKKNRILAQIAKDKLDLETFEIRKNGSIIFHDCAVWCIRDALRAAYEAGRDSDTCETL